MDPNAKEINGINRKQLPWVPRSPQTAPDLRQAYSKVTKPLWFGEEPVSTDKQCAYGLDKYTEGIHNGEPPVHRVVDAGRDGTYRLCRFTQLTGQHLPSKDEFRLRGCRKNSRACFPSPAEGKEEAGYLQILSVPPSHSPWPLDLLQKPFRQREAAAT